jgi:capsular exopolysaccharide synthesis family protein
VTPGGDAALVGALRVLRERWVLIAAVTLTIAAIAAVLSLTATKQYEASATLLIQPSQLETLIDPQAQSQRVPERDAGTNLLLVTSSAVAERAARAIGGGADPAALLEEVSASLEPDADLLTITATDPDPDRAARVANAFAEGFVGFRRETEVRRVSEAEQTLQRQLGALPEAQTSAGTRAQLSQALERVTALRALTTGGAELVDRAGPPGSASAPQPKRDIALGLILGLVGAVGLAFLVDVFDRRLKSVDDVETAYGLRALTTIPERARDVATARERQAALEPFRILRNGLGSVALDGNVSVLVVTSAVQGEGKSTVAAGLARAAALAGQTVALVEADLRRPTFHEQFHLGDDRRGLTAALVAGTPVRELLRPVLPGLKSLLILPAGAMPPNAAELLRSDDMRRVLRELSDDVDLVILDAPPLLPVADAQVLLDHPEVDACVLVARAYRTTRDAAKRARAVLDLHARVGTGLVVNGVRDPHTSYGYYGADLPEPARGRRAGTGA